MTEKKQYIYVLKVTRLEQLTEGPTEREQAVVAEHFAHLKKLTEEGVAILVGRTQNTDASTSGIVVFQAESEEAARELMESDPAVVNGVMSATLYPFRIALMNLNAA
jgi:uncharacterized protein YciI